MVIETESRMVVVMDLGVEGMQSYFAMSTKLQFGKMKKALKMNDGDCCETVNVLHATKLGA